MARPPWPTIIDDDGTGLTGTVFNLAFFTEIKDYVNDGLQLGNLTELTISTGAVTITEAFHIIDTESDDASDDLDTISGGTAQDVLVIRAANDARTVVVKHNTGNIWLKGKRDLVLDDIQDAVILIYDGTKWMDLGGAPSTDWSDAATVVSMIDNNAAAVDFTEAANSYLKFVTSDGTEKITVSKKLELSASLARHIEITGAATSAQLYIGGSAILANGEQAIYVNCPSETVATNAIWLTLKSTVTSGDLTGIRSRVYGNAASAGANVRGGYFEAKMAAASKYAAMLEGALFHADYSAGSTVISGDVRGFTSHISQGDGLTAANLYGGLVNIQTRGNETITSNDVGLMIRNEAVGGNGRTMDSAIKVTDLNMGGGTDGFTYGIDLNGVGITTADIRFSDGQTITPSGSTLAVTALTLDYIEGTTEITINEVGNDVDFRIEGVGAPNAFFVQGSNGKIGLGTATIPHGGVGYAMLALDGANASANGPHVQFTTASDDYPLIQLWNWQHDEIALIFDAYFDGGWKSSDAGSNFLLFKLNDIWRIRYDSGIAQGGAISWNDGISLDISGNVGINATVHGATAIGTLFFPNTATDPTASADIMHIYCRDRAADNAQFCCYQESAVVADADETKFAQKWPVRINGVDYFIMMTTT